MYKSIRNKMVLLIIISVMIIVIISGIYAIVTHRITIVNTPKYNWRIKFDDLREAKLVGTAKEINKPIINTYDTHISNYAVSLTSPGDSVSYMFDVVNAGDYNAIISSVNVPTPMCSGFGNSSTIDEKNVCSNLKYELKYVDGNDVKIGDTLNRGERKTMFLKLSYNIDTQPNQLAKNDLIINNLAVDIIYTQCDKNCF